MTPPPVGLHDLNRHPFHVKRHRAGPVEGRPTRGLRYVQSAVLETPHPFAVARGTDAGQVQGGMAFLPLIDHHPTMALKMLLKMSKRIRSPEKSSQH